MPNAAGAPSSAAEQDSLQPFVRELDVLVRARYPLIYLVSYEEQRVEVILQDLARSHGKTYLTWSATKGVRRQGGGRSPVPLEGSEEPRQALSVIEQLTEPSLVVLKDFHPYLSEPTLVRAVRELAHLLKNTYSTVILLSPVLVIPPELEKELSVLDVPLPSFNELYQLLRGIADVVRKGNKVVVDLKRDEAEQLIRAAQGLTHAEAENAFAKAIADDGRLDRADIRLIQDEKRQIVRKSGLLEFFPVEADLGQVGGLEYLKTWLTRRANAFGDRARKFGLPEPKGLLLLGVQGCGKSLTAKAVAAHWKLPLLRLDVGRIFSGLVGSSEENLRRAIRVAESVAPAVLWVDEIEKGLAGMGGSGTSDGGVSARVFGALLTWLQEKTAPVFVVATSNRVDALPPELLRKGRFDEIFFVDLPDSAEREEILRIHLRRRTRPPERFDIAELAERMEGFSGAEIEQVVIAGLYDAFAEGSDLEPRHLSQAVHETVPLSRTMRHEIERLRTWAHANTRPASKRQEPESAVTRVVRAEGDG